MGDGEATYCTAIRCGGGGNTLVRHSQPWSFGWCWDSSMPKQTRSRKVVDGGVRRSGKLAVVWYLHTHT